MDFHLNLLNDRERAPDDLPSIGIILCAEKYDLEVEYALKSKVNPIGVAEYQLQARLPAEFKGRLPTARQLAGGAGCVAEGAVSFSRKEVTRPPLGIFGGVAKDKRIVLRLKLRALRMSFFRAW